MNVGAWTMNVVSSVGIIMVNKQLMSPAGYAFVFVAISKKIQELMNVPNLTKERIASHLQKFRKYLKKKGLQQAIQYSQEILAAMSSEMLPSTMDNGEGYRTFQPFDQQLPHFLPDQHLSTFQVEVQPQEWANFPQPTNPLLAQLVSNYQTPTIPPLA